MRIYSFLLGILGLIVSVQTLQAQACVTPPTTSQGNTWLPNSVVHISNSSSTLTSPLASSIVGWNSALSAYIPCSGLSFSATTGTLTLSMSYVAIAQQNGHTIRGLTTGTTFDTTAHRLTGATTKINNLVTTPNTIASIITHEIGHTMGLSDCNKCGLNTTIMETGDTVSSINTQINPITPTSCDGLASATFYTCPTCKVIPAAPLHKEDKLTELSNLETGRLLSCPHNVSSLVGSIPEKEASYAAF